MTVDLVSNAGSAPRIDPEALDEDEDDEARAAAGGGDLDDAPEAPLVHEVKMRSGRRTSAPLSYRQ